MTTRTDGRLQRGDQTRRAVLDRAVDIASVEGLEGLSLGRLSKELRISKSGVFAHFGSKEELQLAAVEAGRAVFVRHVVREALRTRPGVERLWRLCEDWLAYSRDRVFSGGCFFYTVTAEFESRPGRVRDALVETHREWRDLLTRTAEDARQLGELLPGADPALLAFELRAFLDTANAVSLLEDDRDAPYAMARTAVTARLDALAPPDSPRPWTGPPSAAAG
ncbi:TetR/AcrR family transcriptional regulator [Nocardiopsis tropica]|jgi:AcrR family transcriptional regulator|uniref:TetR/AcrR family transcriptional regulator n=1 Tax=Nocardiopsis tropica TaxID=109330 RepID=A0ABU7L0K2_9ACTN|nr:TetR/AcrR family transcriptional regulator [Nocardiopsis umidischolae]MEE2055038.1 TetR/AcrR family transcriptional regulator [Nocardiopsis umidischolae]